MIKKLSGWCERHQGILVALAFGVLALVAGLALYQTERRSAARDRDSGRLLELLERQAAALERQAAALESEAKVRVEEARLENLPLPRILPPSPFETVGGAALVRFAAESSGGPARDARLVTVLLCCAHLESLAVKPESALLHRDDSPEVLPLLPAGETLSHEVKIESPTHPVRMTARERSDHALAVWVAFSYRESLAFEADGPRRHLQSRSFLWRGGGWRWQPATAKEHRAIETILRTRGLLDGDQLASNESSP